VLFLNRAVAELFYEFPDSGNGLYCGVDFEARVALFRLEVTLAAGTGKLRIPGGLDKSLRESLNRAFSYFRCDRSILLDENRPIKLDVNC
jgi:predicted ATP-dependent Lon-type protease